MNALKIDGSVVDHVIELRDVYDGWSVAVLADGRRWNRWANDEQTGPAEGYERRYRLTQAWLESESA